MPKASEKTMGNPYFKARKRAAEHDERLGSRAGTYEVTGISEDCLYKYETYITIPPLDSVVRMSDCYRAPELLNHYCANECPIGKQLKVPELKAFSLELAALRLTRASDDIDSFLETIIAVIDDGYISDSEKPQIESAIKGLREVSKRIQEIDTAYKSLIGEEQNSD